MSNVDEHIRRAMEDGKFDDLPGAGKPLHLDENPLGDPEWRLVYHMLQSSGFTLPWIEQRREIEVELEAARTALRRAWAWRLEELGRGAALYDVETEWRRAGIAFQDAADALNKKIKNYNLAAPSERFHLRLVNPEREMQLTTSAPSDTLADENSNQVLP